MWPIKGRCVRVNVLNRRILNVLILLMVTVRRSARSDSSLVHVSRLADTSICELVNGLNSTPGTLSPLISHLFRPRIRAMNLWSGLARNVYHKE